MFKDPSILCAIESTAAHETPVTKSGQQPPVYGVLAGQGRLPALVVEALRAQSHPVFVVAFWGQTDLATVQLCDHAWLRLGQVGRALRALRAKGVTHIILAGGIRRPSLHSLRPDWRGLRLLSRLFRRVTGDNDLLTRIMFFLEGEGFRVVAAHTVLPNLLAFSGLLNDVKLSEGDHADLMQALGIAKDLGSHDIGQAVVVQEGVVLAVEAAEGTDALLARCAEVRHRLPGMQTPGGVLVKVSKPGQDLRADLPTIGAQTVVNAANAGLRGIGIEVGKTLIIDSNEVKNLANQYGLFLVGLSTDAQDLFSMIQPESQL